MRHVCETEKGMVTEIKSEIRMNGDLDEEQRKRLLEIAVRYPLHRTLSSEIKIRTSTVWSDS